MKHKGVWITLAIILVVLLSVGAILYFTGVFPQSGISGFSTLSLQQAELRSANDYLNGKAWILTIRQGGLGQVAEGTFTPSDIQSKTTDQSTTKKDFSITVNYANQQCVYPISSTNSLTALQNVQLNTWTYVPFIVNCDEATANSKGYNNVMWVGKKSFSLTCWAITKTGERTPMGNFGSTDLRSQMTINIDAGDRSGSISLDTEGSTQGKISDFAYAIWQGNLDTGKSCSYTTDMPYRPAYVNGQWRVINKQAYDKFVAKFGEQPDPDYPEIFVSDVNTLVNNARISQSFGAIDNPTSLSSAVLREEIQSPNQYPVITMYVKADTLGIYTPTPQIKLLSANSGCFKTGESGVIRITAKNEGDESGVWNFFGNCVGSTFDITQSREYGFNAGEQKEVTLPISGSASSKQTGTCTIFAESPAGSESIAVSVCVDPQQTCTPNQQFCSTSGGFDVIKKCSSDGATSSIVQNCGSGETCQISGGSPACVKSGGGGGFWDSIGKFFSGLFGGFGEAVNNFIFQFRLYFAIALGLLSAFLGWGYGRKIIPALGIMTQAELSKKFWIPLLIGIIFGAILGILAYIYFWVILIVFIILLIINIFV